MLSETEEGDDIPPHRQAMVLGTPSIASLIARQLQNEGIQARAQAIEGDPLPCPAEPLAFEKLRDVLARFAQAAPRAPGYAHLVHPGTSPWSERRELPALCQELGLAVLCPPAQVLSLFGNKLSLLTEAERAGIPNLILRPDPVSSVREVENLVVKKRCPPPFVLRSALGGGSHGARAINAIEDIEANLPLWIEQLRRQIGEVILFAERSVEGARHLVVPFARVMDGRSTTFPILDASLQSSYRKILEFCPAAGIDPEIEDQLREWTLSFADHCRFLGVGALEFLVDGGGAYLVDGLARLDTAFHLWEKVAGTSAIAWQLEACEGGRTSSLPEMKPVREWSAGVTLRILSEDSLLQLPQPGVIHESTPERHWKFPNSAAELLIDPRILPSAPGILGLLYVGGKDRKQALASAARLLDEIWIAGSLQTNERFLAELLSHPWIREGIFHSRFVDEEFLPAIRPPLEMIRFFSSVCLLACSSSHGTVRWAVGDQWVKPEPDLLKWKVGPKFWDQEGIRGARGVSGTLHSGERVCAYPLAGLPAGRWRVRIGHWVMLVRRVVVSEQGKAIPKTLSLTSGRVHSILFREGAVIPAHEPFLVVESLGMLVPHASPADLRILKWRVSAEDRVHAGQELADIERILT